jgi:hypothetical protein
MNPKLVVEKCLDLDERWTRQPFVVGERYIAIVTIAPQQLWISGRCVGPQ